MSNVGQTASLPSTGSTNEDAMGEALRSMMTGVSSSTVAPRDVAKNESLPNRTSDLESLSRQSQEPENSPEASEGVEPSEASGVGPESQDQPTDIEELELKVKGYKEPFKVKKDWNDEKVQELLNKGARFDKVMQETAQQRKDLEARLSQLQDYSQKAEIADRVESAKALLEKGHHEHALQAILGESADDLVNSLVEERIRYENASPEERLQLDLERQKKAEQLQRQRDADRIAKLEAQINARSAEVQEAEYSGYIEDAKSRYDLSQWIDDSDVAESFNTMLQDSAMAAILKLQRQREAKGEPNITQRDIRREFATRAKRLIAHQESQSSKIADQKVSQQAEVAAKNAKVAASKNYEQPDIMSEWQKTGGSMTDLIALMNGGKGKII